ncbi:MAG TPA: RIP metalloprotease RseP [Candidatus Eisenbacteria bacterium]|nr:RIP metalloprotease RseP [Candidatus Eisenbacteria bacterium]
MEAFAIAALRNLGWVAIVLGIMILVHEFGHYAAAKLFGVRVDVFSIGFGKRLVGFRKNDTDYRISALPLGGYVKMAGENPLESHTGAPDEFTSHPRWQRFVIAAAGPAMNILLAVGLLTGVNMVHYEHPLYLDQPALIGWVVENSPADKAGIQAGDRIVRIDGWQNPTWEDVVLKSAIQSKNPLDVAVQRGNQVLEKEIAPSANWADPEQMRSIGWVPDEPIIVTQLEPKMPAAKAGMRVGDQIIAIDGEPVRSLMAVIRHLQKSGGQPVEITALRNGQEMKFGATPVMTEDNGQKRYRLGFQSEPVAITKLSFGEALNRSLDQNKKYSFLIVDLVRKMVRRETSIKQMEGPIGIARASGEAASQPGWTPLLALMAGISLNLGIFNLLPIPILDGGLILMLVVEGILRRDISMQIKERIYQTAFVFLVLFAVVVIYNDIMKAVPGLAQRLP